MDKSQYDVIPIQKGILIPHVICAIVMILAAYYKCHDWAPEIFWFFCIFGMSWVILALRSFRISQEGIQCRFIGIPYWFIPWSKVKQVGDIHSYPDNMFNNFFQFTLLGCPDHIPNSLSTWKEYYFEVFLRPKLKHPFTVLDIYCNTKKYMSIIEKYYGPLDFSDKRTNRIQTL